MAKKELTASQSKKINDFCNLVISKMTTDNCFSIEIRADGDLTQSDDFIDLMFTYINKLEAPDTIKSKSIDMISTSIEKIHFDTMMKYLPNAKKIADFAAERFNSGERTVELREYVRKHCDASEYFEWEESFWDVAEEQGFTVEDYENLPGKIDIRDTLDLKK